MVRRVWSDWVSNGLVRGLVSGLGWSGSWVVGGVGLVVDFDVLARIVPALPCSSRLVY